MNASPQQMELNNYSNGGGEMGMICKSSDSPTLALIVVLDETSLITSFTEIIIL